MNSFDIGKWVVKLINTSRSYFDLLEFVFDEDAFSTYTRKKSIYRSSPEHIGLIEVIDSVHKEYFTREIQDGIEHAIQNYSNQMIVILATYIETIHSEFFQSLFSNNNMLIYDYASTNNDHNGYIKLNFIFDADSKEEIINNLITIAKKNILNGSLRKINERIFKITKYQIDQQLIDSIQSDILDKRNAIVHESIASMIRKEDIDYYFELTEKYLFELGKACKKSGASCIDQSGWLETT
ncbi:hypothetical protein WCX49_06925 [Sulfurimonas sp. HSL-1656]|uniref:hypothetical protein n=1 Tax=Thiomicrolovo subterrani TaxID=3131934 RepID=UPI0031F9FC78